MPGGRVLIEIMGSDAQLSATVARAEAQLKGLQASGNTAMTGVSRSSGLASKAVLGVGAAAAVVAAASIKMAASFDQAMAKVQGLAGKTGIPMDQLRQKVLDLARATGQDPTGLANALYFVASAGLKTSQVMPVLTMSAKAAAAGMGDASTVAQNLTSLLVAYGKSGLTAAQAMNILTAGIKEGKAKAEDFSAGLGSVIAVAAQAGVSFDQVAAAIATATDAGVPAARAFTGLRFLLQNLEVPTTKAQTAMAAYGISADQIAKMLASPDGLVKVLQMLSSRLDLTTTAGKEAFAAILGGVRGATVALPIVNNMALAVKNANGTLEASKAGAKTFETAYGITTATAAHHFAETITGIKVDMIELGNKLMPIAVAIGSAIGGIAKFVIPLTPEILALVGAFLALRGVSFLIGVVGSLAAGLEKLGAAALVAMGEIGSLDAAEYAAAAATAAWLGPLALVALALGTLYSIFHKGTYDVQAAETAMSGVEGELRKLGVTTGESTSHWKEWVKIVSEIPTAAERAAAASQHVTVAQAQQQEKLASVTDTYHKLIEATFGGIQAGEQAAYNTSNLTGQTEVFRKVLTEVVSAYLKGKVAASDWNVVLAEAAKLGINVNTVIAAYKDHLAQVAAAQLGAAGGARTLATATKQLGDRVQQSGTQAERAAQDARNLAAAHQAAAVAAHTQWLAELGLAGGLLGLQANAVQAAQAEQTLATARDKVTKLAAEGKTGTSAYAAAVVAEAQAALDSGTATVGLAQSVQAYLTQQKAAGVTTAQATANLDAYLKQAGLTKSEIDAINVSLGKTITQFSGIPGTVTTTLNIDVSQAEAQMQAFNAKMAPLGIHIDLSGILHGAKGGPVPGGYGGGDRVPAMLEPGEYVVRKEVVARYGEKMFASLNGMALGGLVGDLGAWRSMVSRLGVSGYKAHLTGIGTAEAAASGAAGVPGTSAQVAAWIVAALKATGEPLSWLADLEVLVAHESGGNPRAYSQIPVASGEHAEGLFQTIPSTFAAHALPGHGDIWNPIDDAIAGIRYIVSRYGSPAGIPGMPNNYVNYAAGGWINEPVVGMGLRSHQAYRFAERGPEYVGKAGGNIYNVHVYAGAADPQQTARLVSMELAKIAHREGV